MRWKSTLTFRSYEGSINPYLVPLRSAPLDLEGARTRFLKLLNPDRAGCLHCGKTEGVQLESSRTAYEKSCPHVLAGEDSTFGGCIAGLEGYPCKQGFKTREECPSWPKDDPNADVLLCRDCAKMHHEYWDEMWNEYNRGRM